MGGFPLAEGEPRLPLLGGMIPPKRFCEENLFSELDNDDTMYIIKAW